YNIPRPGFDEALLARAVAAGVQRVVARARLEPAARNGGGAELALAPETLAAAPALGGRQPDLIVDATGRARLAARALGIGSTVVGGGRRVASVATYSNYQLISQRGHGPGWLMVGDAFGFVDPMLSPGVFLALRSAELVAGVLTPFLRRPATPAPAELASALGSYARVQTAMLAAWSDLVAYLYDGRMLALLRAGRAWVEDGSSVFKSAAQRHIERHIALQATGMGTTARYSRGL